MKNKLKELRREHGLTQEELAQALGVTRQTIIAIENNKYDPSLRLALRISQFFNTPVEDIFKF
ncbi:MAG: helix-turn-helix transcriptional regulator [Dethiobacteria bacterium]|jgi:putative transcriptional regulator|nr:helix-turn-helix transcriptional regulator [Bacillota bacterium]